MEGKVYLVTQGLRERRYSTAVYTGQHLTLILAYTCRASKVLLAGRVSLDYQGREEQM